MKYFATLTTGETYSVRGKTFKKDQEKPVPKELYDYLRNKSAFTCKELPDEMPTIDPNLQVEIEESIVFSENLDEIIQQEKKEKDPNEGVITVQDLGTATTKQHAADKKTTRGTRTRAKDR